MSKEYEIGSDENSDYMYDFIKKICEKVGPRPSCSPNERKASEMVAEELKGYCDSVEIEDFETYPRALHGWVKIAVGLAGVAFLIFLISFLNPALISAICLGIGLFVFYMVYKHLFIYDVFIMKYWPFFKKGISQNVVGTFKPKGEVKKRVVFSGHIDSTMRFNLMHYFRDGYMYALLSGLVGLVFFVIIFLIQLIIALLALFSIDIVLITAIFSLLLNWIVMAIPLLFASLIFIGSRLENFLYGIFVNIERVAVVFILAICSYTIVLDVLLWNFVFSDPNLIKTSVLLFLNGLPSFLGLYFLFASKKTAVMGATDNLSAVAPTMCIAKILKEFKNSYPNRYPSNTEVIVAVVGSEEPGCRGAEAFAIKHREEYNKIDTTCVNMESLIETKHQGIFNKEGTLDFPKDIVDLLVRACEELGYKTDVSSCPPIAGGTDARGFAKYGLRASSLIGLRYKDYLHYYHTDRDNMSIINKERRPLEDIGRSWKNRNVRGAMEMALNVCFKYLELKDKE